VGPRNHVLDEGSDPQGEEAILRVVRPIEKHCETLLRCTQIRLNRSRCRLGVDSCGSKEKCIRWGQGLANPFATVRGDKIALQTFVKFL